MQGFLNRLSWRNLPLRAKTWMMFALLMGLIIAVAVTGLVTLGSVGVQVEVAASTAVDIRTLAQEIERDAATLQRYETRLVEDFTRPGFNPITSSLPIEHANTLATIRENKAKLESLIAGTGSLEQRDTIRAEFRIFDSNMAEIESDFAEVMDLVTRLSDPETGALTRLRRTGTELERLSIENGDSQLLVQLSLMRSLERSLSETGAQADLDAFHEAAGSFSQAYAQVSQGDQGSSPILDVLDGYMQEADEVAELLGQLDIAHRAAGITYTWARNSASRLGNIAQSQAGLQIESVEAIQLRARRGLFAGLFLTLFVGGVLSVLFSRYITQNIGSLLESAHRLETGNLRARARVEGTDELSQLALSFNAMAVQLEGLIGGLEQRVAERTRDLSITAEIGRTITAMHDPRGLMGEIVETIRQRFGFYHTQVFLIDEQQESAILIASTGQAGRELLARQHALPVGSQSVIGQVTARGDPIIALDTDLSPIHQRNELLPDTRSEMALPMRIGDEVIGALDVQSVIPNAFDQDDISVFQSMADQLAVALENARLYSQLSEARETIEMLERRMAGEAWRTYSHDRDPGARFGYQIEEDNLAPYGADAPTPMSEAIRSGHLIAQEDGDTEISLAVPIKVRGEVIGAFGFGGEALEALTEEDIALLEAVADRVGLALENLRLVEQTARRAEHEQIINEITAKIVGSTDVSHILQTTVKELGRVLGAPQTRVQLRRGGKGSSDE